jgi:hypothetical protein
MGFEAFDISAYQKNGFLSEKDYNVLARKVTNAINPMRVNNIRKNLEFTAMSYTDYTKEELGEFLNDGEFNVPLETHSISIPVITSFNANFFPNFDLEYSNPYGVINFIDDTVVLGEVQGQALKQVLNCDYHSLAIAAYDLEKNIKEAYKKSNLWRVSEDVSVLVEFYIPARISCNYDITIKVIFTFYDN